MSFPSNHKLSSPVSKVHMSANSERLQVKDGQKTRHSFEDGERWRNGSMRAERCTAKLEKSQIGSPKCNQAERYI